MSSGLELARVRVHIKAENAKIKMKGYPSTAIQNVPFFISVP